MEKSAENIRKEMHPNVSGDYRMLAELWAALIFFYSFFIF